MRVIVMKISKITILNFRSIQRAEVPLGEITVLIGKNNEGKSNILRAINLALQELRDRRSLSFRRSGIQRPVPLRRRSPRGYRRELDFPVSMRDEKGLKTSIVLDLSLNESEIKEFRKDFESRISGRLPLQIDFGESGETTFKVNLPRSQAKLAKRSDDVATFVSRRLRFEYIESVRTADRTNDEIDSIIARFVRDSSTEKVEEAINTIRDHQDAILAPLSEELTKVLQGFLPSIQAARIANDREGYTLTPGKFQIYVDDGSETPIAQKGDGVQSLAALALVSGRYLDRVGSPISQDTSSRVLAIEEPEAYLHPGAMRDLRSLIYSWAPEGIQVIISTHSPIFVNTNSVSSNLIVQNGTTSPATGIKQIRDILGVIPSDNLFGAERIGIVEGMCDVKFLEAYVRDHHLDFEAFLKDRTVIFCAAGGADRMDTQSRAYRALATEVVALLDDDGAGRESLRNLVQRRVFVAGDVFLCSVDKRSDTEIEDLIDSNFLARVLNDNDLTVDQDFNASRDRFSKRVESLARRGGRPFDKGALDKIKIDLSYAIEHSGSPVTVKTSSVDAFLKRLFPTLTS